MARKRRGPRKPPGGVAPPSSLCNHSTIYTEPLPYEFTRGTGYRYVNAASRWAAATPDSRGSTAAVTASPASTFEYSGTFPGPLVIHGENWIGSIESFQQWAEFMEKHQPTAWTHRHKLYVSEPPSFGHGSRSYMRGWQSPQLKDNQKNPYNWPPHDLKSLGIDPHLKYLRAYFHGVEVEKISGVWEWIRCEHDKHHEPRAKKRKRASLPPSIGLRHCSSGEVYTVRHRPSPDNISRQQLSFPDLLEAMTKHIPDGGDGVCVTVMMFLDHDIFDMSCRHCFGRALSDKRVAVVSEFRHRPELETFNRHLEPSRREHIGWPGSHCATHVSEQNPGLCGHYSPYWRNAKGGTTPCPSHVSSAQPDRTSALAAAIAAVSHPSKLPHTYAQWQTAFFSEVAKTATHEMGHCMGMHHCSYFACLMNPSGSPDKPPYLCPVCLEKMSALLSHLIDEPGDKEQTEGDEQARKQKNKETGGQTSVALRRRWIKERYQALVEMCRSHGQDSVLVAWEAWLTKRLEQLDDDERRRTPGA